MTQEQAITQVLYEQIKGYKSLLELLQKERVSLLDLDAESVENIAKSKDTMLLKLRLLESERQRLVTELTGGSPTLKALAEMTGNQAFLEIRSRLISLMQSIEELNEVNRTLIDKSLSYVRTNLQFFSLFNMGNAGPAKGTLVSRET